MKKMTREEINKRLDKLRKSRLSEESYLHKNMFYKYETAMCYSIRLPESYSVTRKCTTCGNDFEIICSGFGDDETVETLETIIDRYKQVGLDAELIYNCPDCVQKTGCNDFEVHLKAFDEKEWHVSIPFIAKSNGEYGSNTSKFEYNAVLRFLSIYEEIDDVPAFFDNLYNVEFRKQQLEFFVGKDLVERIGLKAIKQDFSYDDQRKKDNVEWRIQKRKDADRDREKLRQMIIDDPNLFYSGKKPIDFYAEKDLTVWNALELIRADIGSNSALLKKFSCLYSNIVCKLIYENTFINKEEYGQDFQKLQVDRALSKVLGLTILYDLEEVRNSIACSLFDVNMVSKIGKAYEKLEKSGKKSFTVEEYFKFIMNFCRNN